MPRRYRADGTRLWNGKTPEEFTEADAYRFMAETEAVLQRKELMDDPAQPAPASGKEEFYLSKKDDVLLTPEQIAAEERRWLFDAPIAELAMHITNEFVSQAVDQNFHEGAATWCYFDEFHILLRDPLTASYFVAVWKMLRKKGCVPSALTQNVKDLLASREIENILDNTDFMILLSQAQSDRTILAKQLGISEHQLSYITHSNSGEGLLFYGNVTIPFVDRFPRGEIYDLLTTRPEDMKNETKNE